MANPKPSGVLLECCLGRGCGRSCPFPVPGPFPRPRSSSFPMKPGLNRDGEEFLLRAHGREIHGKFQDGKSRNGGMQLNSGQGDALGKLQCFPAPNSAGSTFSHLSPTKHSRNFRNAPNSTCRSQAGTGKNMENSRNTRE